MLRFHASFHSLVPWLCVLALVACSCSDAHTAADGGGDGSAADGGETDAATPDAAADGGAGTDAGEGDAGGACPPDRRFFELGCGPVEPGSGIRPLPEAGCYIECSGAGDPVCPDGTACERAWVNPCPCEPGEECCGACGGEQWLCLEPEVQMCGGFAGLECPDGEVCVDDPSDACDPDMGGADCPGICVAPGCEPMDARGMGACDAFFGYAWNGRECVGLSGCSCEGADCDATYDSAETCRDAYAGC